MDRFSIAIGKKPDPSDVLEDGLMDFAGDCRDCREMSSAPKLSGAQRWALHHFGREDTVSVMNSNVLLSVPLKEINTRYSTLDDCGNRIEVGTMLAINAEGQFIRTAFAKDPSFIGMAVSVERHSCTVRIN
jgi:hypothetical protein